VAAVGYKNFKEVFANWKLEISSYSILRLWNLQHTKSESNCWDSLLTLR